MIDEDELREAASIIRRYCDRDIAVTDASIVVLAARHHTRSVLSLDHRHVNLLRPLGGCFRLLP